MPPALYATPDMAFVLGLLADLERGTQKLELQLAEAVAQARLHDAVFEAARQTWLSHNERLRALQVATNQAARALAEANGQCATLMQDIGNLNRKSDDVRVKMQAQSPDSDAYRQLRRVRAALGVQLEDRNKALAVHQGAAATERAKVEAAQQESLAVGDAARLARIELKALQAEQPAASLHLDLFTQRASQAHALITLEAHETPAPSAQDLRLVPVLPPRAKDAKAAWRTRMLAASRHIVALYEGLAQGRYAVESSASWAGGRSVAVSESLYALVAIGELEAAIDLYGLSSANDAFFHHIFQTFRGGCLGLFLVGRHNELGEALRLHQDSQGIRGAYVQAYSGLLYGHQADFHDALSAIHQAEWRQWRKTTTPGLGLVNVSVLGLLELSRLRGFAMPKALGGCVPWMLRPR